MNRSPHPTKPGGYRTLPLLILSLTLGPSALALLEIPQVDSGIRLRLVDPPTSRLTLAESWRPPTLARQPSAALPFSLNNLHSLGGLFDEFIGALPLPIPDDSTVGVTSEKTVQGLPAAIASVQVQLHLAPRDNQPMFNGDLHVTLSHGLGYAVLLNRTGRREGFGAGYGDSGFQVTLSDDAPADIHTYRIAATGSHTTPLSNTDVPSALTGVWQPDGRSADPFLVVINSNRDAMLSSFAGLDPNGLWTLHVSDLSQNGLGQVVDWGLQFTLVPEPAPAALLATVALASLAALRRRSNRAAERPARRNPSRFMP